MIKKSVTYKKKDKKFNLKPVIVVVMAVALVSSVILSIELATSGAEISKLEGQEADLISQNNDLTQKIVKGSSLSGVEEKSQELGYSKPSKIIYLNSTEAQMAKLP